MNPIYLYLTKDANKHSISVHDKSLLRTPGGNVFSHENKEVIENVIYDLQRYSDVEIDENNCISGDPLTNVSFCSLACTEIDFWSNNREIPLESISELLPSDPFTNLSPGPEVVDQLHQWGSIIKKLEEFDFPIQDIQHYSSEENSNLDDLAKMILSDFNNSSSASKSVFINLLNMYHSVIGSWLFVYHNLSGHEFATALTETANFQFILNDLIEEEMLSNRPDNLPEDVDYDYDEKELSLIRNKKRVELYEESLKVFDSCKKYIDSSNYIPTELSLEESITHEFKSSFRKPFPDYPEASVDEKNQTIFKLQKHIFKSKKQVNSFIEGLCLKTIVAFLNTRGGKLVIGVSEKDNKKEIVGIENDDFSSQDDYERHLTQQISNRIGKKFCSDFITIYFLSIDNKTICVVNCDPYIPKNTEIPAHLDGEHIYRRTGARSDLIKPGVESAKFVAERKSN